MFAPANCLEIVKQLRDFRGDCLNFWLFIKKGVLQLHGRCFLTMFQIIYWNKVTHFDFPVFFRYFRFVPVKLELQKSDSKYFFDKIYPSQLFKVGSTLWINVEITLIRRWKWNKTWHRIFNVDTTLEADVKQRQNNLWNVVTTLNRRF